MEKKIFYTLQQQKGVKGVRKECGYELEIATRKLRKLRSKEIQSSAGTAAQGLEETRACITAETG